VRQGLPEDRLTGCTVRRCNGVASNVAKGSIKSGFPSPRPNGRCGASKAVAGSLREAYHIPCPPFGACWPLLFILLRRDRLHYACVRTDRIPHYTAASRPPRRSQFHPQQRRQASSRPSWTPVYTSLLAKSLQFLLKRDRSHHLYVQTDEHVPAGGRESVWPTVPISKRRLDDDRARDA
jgi:hypothetical protein